MGEGGGGVRGGQRGRGREREREQEGHVELKPVVLRGRTRKVSVGRNFISELW